MVFWRETGMKDDDDDVEAREGAWSIETAMGGERVETRWGATSSSARRFVCTEGGRLVTGCGDRDAAGQR